LVARRARFLAARPRSPPAKEENAMPSLRRLFGFIALVCSLLFIASPVSAQGTRYPVGPIHSPMTANVVARLKRVLAASGGAKDAFVKIGDSNTANPGFLNCFAGRDVKLGGHTDLEATRRFFGARKVDLLHTSFDRSSGGATIGWLAGNVLAGAPSPLEREIAAVKPAFAVVMLGTNDNRPGGLEVFTKNITTIVDRSLSLGVVPLLSTIPPRDDSPAARARVPAFNDVIRALAESRQVPLMDLYSALVSLPRRGLVSDGIHLASRWEGDAPRACSLAPDALDKGMNTRNLVVLTALDRARRFLIDDEVPEPEPAPGV